MNKKIFITLLILLVLSCTFAGTCYAEDPVLCPHCNGTGKYTCSICGGDGVLTCTGCNGAGIVDATDGSKVACTVCQGTGEMDCTDSNCVISRESNGMCPYCQGCGYVDSFTGGAATGGTVIGGSSSSNTQGGTDNTDDANSILNGGGSSLNKQQNDGKLKLNQNNNTQYVDLLDGNTEEGKAKLQTEGTSEDEEDEGELTIGSEEFWVKVGMYGFIAALVFLAIVITVCAIVIKSRKRRDR